MLFVCKNRKFVSDFDETLCICEGERAIFEQETFQRVPLFWWILFCNQLKIKHIRFL
jgi:hypothetical protein